MMMQSLKRYLIGVLASSLLVAVVVSPTVGALDLFPACEGNSDSKVCSAKDTDKASNLIQNITSLFLWLIGAVSAIMIIIGGFKFITANGDANRVKAARDTIMYSVVGLAVAIMGNAIIYFVVRWFT